MSVRAAALLHMIDDASTTRAIEIIERHLAAAEAAGREAGAAAEREACARIARSAPGNQEIGGENWTADAIARQIRARSKVE